MSSNRPAGGPPDDAADQAAQRRRERRMLALIAVAVVVVLVGGGLALQLWRTSRAPAAPPVSAATSLAPQALVDGQPIRLGNAAAKVKIRLYEDFHCPHCADFEEEFGPTITAAQSSGQAVVELYPLAFIDAGSVAAANGVACAAEAGFGQAYYAGLFTNHTLQWSDEQLVQLATQVAGTASPGFSTCVAKHAHAAWVESIGVAASAAGVTGTPTVFINDTPVTVASLTPDTLRTMIEQAASR